MESDAQCVGFFFIFAAGKKCFMETFKLIVIVLLFGVVLCAFLIPLVLIIRIFFAFDEENDYVVDDDGVEYDG